jgi:hypothetical protein
MARNNIFMIGLLKLENLAIAIRGNTDLFHIICLPSAPGTLKRSNFALRYVYTLCFAGHDSARKQV